MSTLQELVTRLAVEGGCLVASADCSEIEIADARVRGDWYVDAEGFGYVRRLPEWLRKHSRFARGHTEDCCELKVAP